MNVGDRVAMTIKGSREPDDELFCILNTVEVTRIFVCDESTELNAHTHTHTN